MTRNASHHEGVSMYNEQRDHGFAVGVITGAMVGAGLALLFAPKAGAELRGDLNDSLASVRDAVARRYHALAEMAGVELDNIEERIDRVTESVEAGAREVLDTATPRRPTRPRSAQG
jgi:gas vesicle protein